MTFNPERHLFSSPSRLEVAMGPYLEAGMFEVLQKTLFMLAVEGLELPDMVYPSQEHGRFKYTHKSLAHIRWSLGYDWVLIVQLRSKSSYAIIKTDYHTVEAMKANTKERVRNVPLAVCGEIKRIQKKAIKTLKSRV
jgi:hypothetical protein